MNITIDNYSVVKESQITSSISTLCSRYVEPSEVLNTSKSHFGYDIMSSSNIELLNRHVLSLIKYKNKHKILSKNFDQHV